MKNILYPLFFFAVVLTHAQPAGLQVGHVLIVNYPTVPDPSPAAFQAIVRDALSSTGNKPGVEVRYFQADRGTHKDQPLLVCSIKNASERSSLPAGSPFASGAANGQKYTEYHLIDADKFGVMPVAGILGFHYLKIKPERAAEFEKFVVGKLHPAVGHLFPDMQMLYFKAVAGEAAGSYITIWTIRSEAARDKYWPAGSPETAALIAGYKPHNELAKTLETFLVPDSYLKPGRGAAAIFESIEWTDYVIK